MSYGLEGKPEWYDRAVQMKLDNPDISAAEIARQIGKNPGSVIYWLTGTSHTAINKLKRPSDSFPFEPGDFPQIKKYYDGTKPEWYDQALQMAKAGEKFINIAKKFGVSDKSIGDWLVKGRKDRRGKIVNPDAELEPRRIAGQKLDINLINSLIQDYQLSDEEIIELIIDDKGPKIANLVKDKLPDLRQKLKAKPQVTIDKSSGTDISGFVK